MSDLIDAIVRLWQAIAALPGRIVDALDPYAEYDRHRQELWLLARGVVVKGRPE